MFLSNCLFIGLISGPSTEKMRKSRGEVTRKLAVISIQADLEPTICSSGHENIFPALVGTAMTQILTVIAQVALSFKGNIQAIIFSKLARPRGFEPLTF